MTPHETQRDYEARVHADAADEQETLDTTPDLADLAERYRRERGKAYQVRLRTMARTHGGDGSEAA